MNSTLPMPKWHTVLVEILKSRENHRYAEKLNRRLKSSKTHLRKVVRSLEQQGLVTIVPDTKIKRLIITEKGRRVASFLMEIDLALDRT